MDHNLEPTLKVGGNEPFTGVTPGPKGKKFLRF